MQSVHAEASNGQNEKSFQEMTNKNVLKENMHACIVPKKYNCNLLQTKSNFLLQKLYM